MKTFSTRMARRVLAATSISRTLVILILLNLISASCSKLEPTVQPDDSSEKSIKILVQDENYRLYAHEVFKMSEIVAQSTFNIYKNIDFKAIEKDLLTSQNKEEILKNLGRCTNHPEIIYERSQKILNAIIKFRKSNRWLEEVNEQERKHILSSAFDKLQTDRYNRLKAMRTSDWCLGQCNGQYWLGSMACENQTNASLITAAFSTAVGLVVALPSGPLGLVGVSAAASAAIAGIEFNHMVCMGNTWDAYVGCINNCPMDQ